MALNNPASLTVRLKVMVIMIMMMMTVVTEVVLLLCKLYKQVPQEVFSVMPSRYSVNII